MKAKGGDYLVFESNQMVTLLNIRSRTANSLILEEIAAPRRNLKKNPSSWTDWVKAKAPGHTSWSMIEIDLHTNQIIECYSFSQAAWIQLAPSESLFATLLQLPLHSVPAEQQRRIGPPPAPGEADVRQVWQPPLIHEGNPVLKARFEAFRADWPQDGTELAGKAITLYFDQNLQFPLPFWVSVEAPHGTAVLHAIDSGRSLHSPCRSLPKRVPQFIGAPKRTEQGLSLTVKSPRYFRSFELFVADVTTKEKKIFPISHSLVHGIGELLTIEIGSSDLELLEQGHRYTWLLVPDGHSESYTETSKPFVWAVK